MKGPAHRVWCEPRGSWLAALSPPRTGCGSGGGGGTSDCLGGLEKMCPPLPKGSPCSSNRGLNFVSSVQLPVAWPTELRDLGSKQVTNKGQTSDPGHRRQWERSAAYFYLSFQALRTQIINAPVQGEQYRVETLLVLLGGQVKARRRLVSQDLSF